jgi:hypothetical protein
MRVLDCLLYTFLVLVFFSIAKVAWASPYDVQVLQDRPSLYLRLSAPAGSAYEPDRAHRRFRARYLPAGSPEKTTMPNGDPATVFDGRAEYVELASSGLFSVPAGGALTIEAWIRPDTLEFPLDEGSGYVHWAGKGEPGQHEYVMRIYSKTNSEGRPNRISGYVFNPQGGLGSGSYFQDPVRVGEWLQVVSVIDTGVNPAVISLYKNGVLRKTTLLSQFNVVPAPGTAPLRIATRDFGSFFAGAIGKFALYQRALTTPQIAAHYAAMMP